MTDWAAWHRDYEDVDSPLAQRLETVRGLLEAAIGARERAELRVLSLCAGDGRDVLPVLNRWKTELRVRGRLIELDPQLAERARGFVAENELAGIDVLCGDAARTANYLGAVPADLLIVCGVFGNIRDADVLGLIETMPRLCAEGASVVWTRHRREPDLTPRIREWFSGAGFVERAFESPGVGRFSVGMHELAIPPRPIGPTDERLFSFVR